MVGATQRGSRLWLFRVLALVLGPLLILGGLELGLRLAGYGYPTAFLLRRPIQGQDSLVENRRFGWRFFGPTMARAPRVLAGPAHQPPETVRVFVLGESAAYGDPQPEFGLPRLLEVLLRDRVPDVPFEVINAAMTAINSHVVLPIARDCSRAQGDIWVIYMGNNEVIGPFGVGTVFGARGAGLGLVRWLLALKAMKVGQLLQSATGALRPGPADEEDWGGMRMFAKHRIPPEDGRLETVYRHFARNLEAIFELGLRRGTRIVVSTVASNLKDCAPFASEHGPALGPAALVEWTRAFEAGVQAQGAGRWGEACQHYQQAAGFDDRFAELQFRWGQCCLALGQDEEARRHFTLARDDDALRFRADGRLNRLVRQAADGREAAGIYFVDAEQALSQQSPRGLTGADMFYEHVHLTFEGNYWLARAIAEQVVRAMPERVTQRAVPRREWLPLAECARRLAWAGWNRYEATASILRRVNDTPFTLQFDHAVQRQRLQTQLEQLRRELTSSALQQAAEECDRARARAPRDWVLDQNLSRLLRRLGDLRGAAEALGRVLERVPHHVEAHVQRGILLAQSGQPQAAAAEFEAALRLEPRSVQAWDGLGRILAMQGKREAAVAHYRRALKIRPSHCESLVNLGLAFKQMGKPEAARDCFRQACQHPPNQADGLKGLARICHDEGWYAEAAALFTAALALDPLDASAHLHLGITLSSLGRTAEARQQFAEAARLEPGSAETYFRLGLESGRAGMLSEALESFSAAVRLKPDYVEAHANLGIALFKQGRLPEALDQFQTVLRLEPRNAVAQRYLEIIRNSVASANAPAGP